MSAAVKWQDWPLLLPEHKAGGQTASFSLQGMAAIRRLLQELMSEQLLPFQVLATQDDRICYEIKASDKEGRAIAYRCHGRTSASFGQVLLADENIMRVCELGQRPVASLQELVRELGPISRVCELALARRAREIEQQWQAEMAGSLNRKRRLALQEVLLLDGESALQYCDLLRVDAEGEAVIGEWIAQHGARQWIDALLEATLQPMLHLLYAHGIGIEADTTNMVLLHKNGLPVRISLKELPSGLHLAAQFSACAGVEPSLTQSADATEPGDGGASQVLAQFYAAAMMRNFGQLSIFMREYFRWPELTFWQQVAACIYRYQDARPQMAMRFASFDLFAPQVQVFSPLRAKFLGEENGLRRVSNPLFRCRRPGFKAA
ncbi:IucA/IucC family C-terminal-domain containing protein [Massilia sp. W12]|uniref:IucA/IucC family C-terminal-domain containing protein n=1 Tax=Massilia sp. W12 TaxID=3126507 RepID=UPI0030CC3915